MKPFKLFCEQSTTGIGLFPGAFKPPHKGHFETLKKASIENKLIAVLVSSSSRDNISATDSLTIWNIYKPYLPKNIHVYFVQGSPVTAIYQVVDLINNDKFSPTPQAATPMPVATEISKDIQKLSDPYTVNVYASKEDMDRFNAFSNSKTRSIYIGKKVKNILRKDVDRLASATDARNAVLKRNYEEFKEFLPDIAKEDKLRIYNLLIK